MQNGKWLNKSKTAKHLSSSKKTKKLRYACATSIFILLIAIYSFCAIIIRKINIKILSRWSFIWKVKLHSTTASDFNQFKTPFTRKHYLIEHKKQQQQQQQRSYTRPEPIPFLCTVIPKRQVNFHRLLLYNTHHYLSGFCILLYVILISFCLFNLYKKNVSMQRYVVCSPPVDLYTWNRVQT